MSILIFIYGLLIGSFLNVCIYRIPEGKSIVFPGSSCGSCHTRLGARDLIPVLSWLMTRGTCRYCGEKVSIQYPLVEIATGVLTVLIYQYTGLGLNFIWACFLLWSGIVVALIDWRHELIPDRLNMVIGIGGLLHYMVQIGQTQSFMVWPLLGALLGGGFLLLLAFVSTMGGGDIKYMAAAGLFLGPGLTILALYIGFILGGLVALILLLSKKVKRGMHIPFGPYLAIGVVIAYVYGHLLLNTYFSWIYL